MKTNFRHFSEYLTSQGKLDKTKIDASADTGPTGDKSPKPAATKGKGWEAQVKSTDKPKPYASTSKPVGKDWSEHPKGEKGGQGFADKGDKKLAYDPKTPKDFGKEGGKKVASWPKTTKEFLDTTNGMTVSELACMISDMRQVDQKPLPVFSEEPTIAAIYVSALANINNGVMETLVREMKRLGCLDRLVSEIFKHPEACQEVANIVANDGGVKTRLDRAITESLKETVDAPASKTEEGAPAKPRKNVKSIGGEKLDMSGSGVLSTRGQSK